MKQPYSIRQSIHIQAPTQRVYSVWTDVEQWPLWTSSVREVSLLGIEALTLGGRVQVQQPQLGTVIWSVTTLDHNRKFSWQSRQFGVLITAHHDITPTAQGAMASAVIEYQGFLAGLIGRIGRKLAMRFMQLELQGLKAQCEKP